MQEWQGGSSSNNPQALAIAGRCDLADLPMRQAHAVEVGYDEAEDLVVVIDGEEVSLSEIDWRPGLSLFKAVLDAWPRKEPVVAPLL